ncbi:hypothetical protein HZC07_01770 [Candidatus Micrarchaeota archaeon]|nr:hypothetical protein [Candidatus Micrarchaeota archaeon]
MGTCSRCGASGEMEYGTDGLSYCSSCVFYGMNKQCFKCRMYVPGTELQQYKGQWLCPSCNQDMRSSDRKLESREEKKDSVELLSYSETCDRCGKVADRLYRWNGRNLCKSCLTDEQDKWELVRGAPSASSYRIPLGPIKKEKEKSFIEAIISDSESKMESKPSPKAEGIITKEKTKKSKLDQAKEKILKKEVKKQRKGVKISKK